MPSDQFDSTGRRHAERESYERLLARRPQLGPQLIFGKQGPPKYQGLLAAAVVVNAFQYTRQPALLCGLLQPIPIRSASSGQLDFTPSCCRPRA
jgi:hypothetical protein